MARRIGAAAIAAVLLVTVAVLVAQDTVPEPAEEAAGERMPDYEFTLVELEAKPIVVVRRNVPVDSMMPVMMAAFDSVMAWLARERIEPVGAPLTLYYGFDDGTVELATGHVVPEPVEGSGVVLGDTLPGGQVVMTTHWGDYGELPSAHEALEGWIATHGMQQAGPVWEVYVTDPGVVEDVARWRTDLYMPVRPGPGGDGEPYPEP